MNITYRFYRLTSVLRSKIGYRTLKTAVATPLSMAIAQALGVSNVATAGILTMLCIQPSRRKSFETASHRFLACLLAIAFSAVFFEIFGYSAIVLAILLMVFIPTTIFFKIERGIFTSTVITLNIYLFEKLNIHFITNQLYLIVIGIGVGFLVNLYMPSLDKQLENLKKSVEVRFKIIFLQIAQMIKMEDIHWDKKEIEELETLFTQSSELVMRDRENRMLNDKHSYYEYFQMRRHQFDILQEILILVERLSREVRISSDIALFIDNLGKDVHTEDTASYHLKELNKLKQQFKNSKPPKTYEGFEARSVLFQLLFEIERYLSVKQNLMQPEKRKRRRLRISKTQEGSDL